MMQRIEKTFAGRKLVIETGRMAKQASGSAVVQFGDTMVIAACTVSDKETTLPIDQHELIALIAPRPVHVASAEDDKWADPYGEFLGAKKAEPVYALFGKKGLGVDAMPAIHQPVLGDAIAYHIRAGKHDITAYDWGRYLDYADKVLRAK